jgi:hypothetical protein
MLKNCRLFSIYVLRDPRPQYQGPRYEICGVTGTRYIGQTFKSVQHRFNQHLSEDSNPYKRNWFRALKRDGVQPEVVTIYKDISSQEEADRLEQNLIAQAREKMGNKLLNLAIGGQGVYYSDEQMEESRTRYLEGADGYLRPGNTPYPNLRDAVCPAVRKQMLTKGNRYIREIDYTAERDSLMQLSTIQLGTKLYFAAYCIGFEGGALPPGKLVVETGYIHGKLSREGYAKPLEDDIIEKSSVKWPDQK